VALERFDADAVHDVDEAFMLGLALLEIDRNEPLDDVGDLVPRDRRTDNTPERCLRALPAADGDLVPPSPFLSTPDADVPT
jgi:hypothetical protein